MQNTKDTFYVTLRDRLAALNPGRTLVLRGTTRPASLVEENELTTASLPLDTFCLRWIGSRIAAQGTMPLLALQCEIHYSTAGSSNNSGMDRGRLLAAMDAELLSAVMQIPQNTVKTNYAAEPATTLSTQIFWSDLTFAPATVAAEQLRRMATLEVFNYQEAGEL